MDYLNAGLGARQVGDDPERAPVAFRLFFPAGVDPQIQPIRVAGDFQTHLGQNNWDFGAGPLLTREDTPDGTFWTYTTPQTLPKGFYQYKYLVTFTNQGARIASDPFARYGGTDHQNAAFVIGGSQPADTPIAPLRSGRKPQRDLIVYEMHADDFTDEFRDARAPFDAVQDKLDYLVDLGINGILFMPWTTWTQREFDWGYAPFQYFAVEYRYANNLEQPEEKLSWLARLVSACHERDVHVIMDGVFNHVSPDFPYRDFYLDPESCPFTGTFGGEFAGLQDLNFENTCTREFIRDVCLYWIATFGIDGIRFDNTVNYLKESTAYGIPELLSDVQAYLDDHNQQNFSLTLEHLNEGAARLVNETAATSYWDNALYGASFGGLWDGQIGPGLLNALTNYRYLTDAAKAPTVYLSNHDHSHLTWQAGARTNQGSLRWYKTQPYAIALLTAPCVPMIQNGQEFGEDYWIPEDDQGSGRRIRPRPLRWKRQTDPIGTPLWRLYRRLAAIRQAYPALRGRNFYPSPWAEWQTRFNPAGFGVDTERQVVLYHRWGNNPATGALQRFYIVLNFSDQPRSVTVPLPANGQWRDLLSNYDGNWTVEVSGHRLDLEVGSNWGHIFFREE